MKDVNRPVLMDEFDGVLRRRQWWDNDGHTLITEVIQPGHKKILQRNADMRNSVELFTKLESMQWALQIPTNDYAGLLKKHPDLEAPDGEIRNKAWRAFIQSSEAAPYRVRPQRSKMKV